MRVRMRRQLPLLLIANAVLAFSLMLLSAVKAESNDLAAQLKAQADRWDSAIVAKRRDEIEANLADDFRQINSAGQIKDKQSFVNGLLDPNLQIDPYKVEDFEVRLYGEVALLSGRTQMTGRYGDESFTAHYRYIDIYVLREGVWKVVSVQITKMAE